MLRVEQVPPGPSGAAIRWQPRAPARAQARLWGIFLEVASGTGVPVSPLLVVELYGLPVLEMYLEPVQGGSVARYHVSFSGQGTRQVWTVGTDTWTVEIAPRLPWIPPDAPAGLTVDPNNPAVQVTMARVVWEDLPWSSQLPRRMSPEMVTRQDRR